MSQWLTLSLLGILNMLLPLFYAYHSAFMESDDNNLPFPF